MRKRISLLPLIMLVAMPPGHVPARPAEEMATARTWYQVEVLLFEQTADPDPEGEQFPQDINPPAADNAQHLLPTDQPPASGADTSLLMTDVSPQTLSGPGMPATTMPVNDEEQAFRLLAREHFELRDEETAIRRSSRYILLGHYAWRQPVAENAPALAVWLDTRPQTETTATADGMHATPVDAGPASWGGQSGQEATVHPMPATPGLADQPAMPAEVHDEPRVITELVPDHVRGLLRISKGRYLHVAPDLFHQRQRPLQPVVTRAPEQVLPLVSLNPGTEGQQEPPVDEVVESMPEPPASPYLFYRMSQKRRVRSGELHYFDHPAFGLLVKLTPYERQENTGEAESLSPEQHDR